MQATREEFTAAVSPILLDLETVGPGLLGVALEPESSEMQAVLFERDGSGTGVWLRPGLSVAEATVELASEYDEVFSEAAWAVTGNGTWPECPRDVGGPPMMPALVDGVAVWTCWDCGLATPIGQLKSILP